MHYARRLILAVAVIAGLAGPAVIPSTASAASARRCLATASGTVTGHDAYMKHTNSCGQERAFLATSTGYHFGAWVTANGATSHVHTTLVARCGGWEGGNGILHHIGAAC